MEVRRADKDTLELGEIDEFLAELIRQAPAAADPEDNRAARARLYSPPTHPSEHKRFRADWKSYVEPDLRTLFQSANETVVDDLKRMSGTGLDGNEPVFTLQISRAHAEAWLSTLNQARLVLAAKNDFTDEELSRGGLQAISSRRDLSLFQINFYAVLQELILREFFEV